MTQAIRAALAKLDAGNDNHWTDDGLPRMETVKLLLGNPGITRDEVTRAAPGFSRANTALDAPAPAPAPSMPPAAPGQDVDTDNDLEAAADGSGDVDTPAEAEQADNSGALAAAQAALERAIAAKHAADAEFKAAQEAVDRLVEARASATPVHQGQLTIQAYLRSQRYSRGAGRSPIDAAFARPKARPKAL